MKHLLFILIIAGAVFSCNHHAANGNAGGTDSGLAKAPDSTAAADSNHTFFPIADFIGGQLRMVDSLQLPITKSVTINHKTTLAPLTDAEFKALAAAFRQPDIN